MRSVPALGEPLLQGLNEIANKKPQDPISYLANFLYNFSARDPGGEDTQVSARRVGQPALHGRSAG